MGSISGQKISNHRWKIYINLTFYGEENRTIEEKFLSNEDPSYPTLEVFTNCVSYLKNESTNSLLLKTCKSSIPSPTPIYFTGI